MRTDGDTWDINTGVGSTALFVAAARALETQKPDPVAVDPLAGVFCRAAGGQWTELLDGGAPDHALRSEFGADFVNFQAVRTRYFDDYFRTAAADGVRQVVLLAAGFDATRPSAWIAEGLLIYLPATAQRELFAGIDSLAAPGSHVAVEEATPTDPAALAAKRDEERRSGQDETFFNLIYNEQHAPAAHWFGGRGWRAQATPLTEALRTHGRRVPEPGSEAATMTDTISLVSAVRA